MKKSRRTGARTLARDSCAGNPEGSQGGLYPPAVVVSDHKPPVTQESYPLIKGSAGLSEGEETGTRKGSPQQLDDECAKWLPQGACQGSAVQSPLAPDEWACECGRQGTKFALQKHQELQDPQEGSHSIEQISRCPEAMPAREQGPGKRELGESRPARYRLDKKTLEFAASLAQEIGYRTPGLGPSIGESIALKLLQAGCFHNDLNYPVRRCDKCGFKAASQTQSGEE